MKSYKFLIVGSGMTGDAAAGMLLWNVWEKLEEARALLEEAGPFEAKDLIGKIKVK